MWQILSTSTTAFWIASVTTRFSSEMLSKFAAVLLNMSVIPRCFKISFSLIVDSILNLGSSTWTSTETFTFSTLSKTSNQSPSTSPPEQSRPGHQQNQCLHLTFCWAGRCECPWQSCPQDKEVELQHYQARRVLSTAEEIRIKMLQDTHVFRTRQFWRLGDLLWEIPTKSMSFRFDWFLSEIIDIYIQYYRLCSWKIDGILHILVKI